VQSFHSVDLLVQPASIYIPLVTNLLKNKSIQVCAQNHSYYGLGAYTGEVSAIQLKDLGIKWSMAGHSERRSYFYETNDVQFMDHELGHSKQNETGD